MIKHKLTVTVEYDDEVGVWIATSKDSIPGLVTEAGSLEGVFRKVALVAPDLLTHNDQRLPKLYEAEAESEWFEPPFLGKAR